MRLRNAAFGRSVTVFGLILAGAGCGGNGDIAVPSDDRAAAAASVSSAVAALTDQTGLPSSVITLDVNQVDDCTALAWTLTPMLTSLGDLSAEDANKLDQSVIAKIGVYLDAIEVRRGVLGCDEAGWKVARCDALKAADTSMANQMAAQFCSGAPTAPSAAPSTTPASTPATNPGAAPVTATSGG